VLQRDWYDFATGDLKGLCGDYGLPAAAPHHCLYCEATASHRARYWTDVKDTVEPRTLATIDRDYGVYLANSQNGPVHGVKAPRIAGTPIDRVMRPPLHTVTLGPTCDMYKYLRKEARSHDGLHLLNHELVERRDDLEELLVCKRDQLEQEDALVKQAESEERKAKNAFEDERMKLPESARGPDVTEDDAKHKGCSPSTWKRFQTARAVHRDAAKELEEARDDQTKIAGEVSETEKELAEVSKELGEVGTPFMDGIKAGLSEIGVDPLTYFGGDAFVGAMGYKFLEKRKEFFDKALANVPPATQKDIRDRYEPAMALLALINRDLRRAKSLSEAKIKEVGENIRLFSDLYRATFQSKQGSDQATPKAHCLEAHFVSDDPNFPEFVQRWRNSGIFGEDAIESTHAKINRLKRRAFGIRNRLDRKKFLVRAHDDSQHPSALEAIDESRKLSKRKKGDDSKGRKKKRRKKA